MKATAKSLHNTVLYEELAALCSKESAPSVRQGKMFGCPALYVGRKMALCVYEDTIGMRVPEDVAMRAKASDRAVPFTPLRQKANAQMDCGRRARRSFRVSRSLQGRPSLCRRK